MAALVGMLFAVPARAQRCKTFLDQLQTWFVDKLNGPGTHDISLTMATKRSNEQYFGYSDIRASPAEERKLGRRVGICLGANHQ
jgi:hypothetical protein